MAESRHTGRPAGVTQAKHSSYLHHVRIHMDLLLDSLAGAQFGCGVGEADREAIGRHLFDIWKIASAAKLEVVERPPAAPGTQGGNVIPFRPRLAN